MSEHTKSHWQTRRRHEAYDGDIQLTVRRSNDVGTDVAIDLA